MSALASTGNNFTTRFNPTLIIDTITKTKPRTRRLNQTQITYQSCFALSLYIHFIKYV